jgi:CRISPR-associated endonuclease Csn1
MVDNEIDTENFIFISRHFFIFCYNIIIIYSLRFAGENMNHINKIYTERTHKISKKLNGRPYRVGLDLGVGSIGYAVGALSKNSDTDYIIEEIILSGSRIFIPSSGTADRRTCRGQRNALRHKHNRLDYLWKILAEQDLMLPYCKAANEADTAVVRFSERVRTLKSSGPYKLRYRGLSEKLERDEIGYCIYHISNHRGSSSVRTFLDMSPEEIKNQQETGAKEQILKNIENTYNYKTFIEILFAVNKKSFKGFRNNPERCDVPIPTRDVILNELNTLLANQKKHYPDIFTDEYCERIVQAVDYENEKLVPEAGSCPYFPKEAKLPKCSFLNEERRLWEALNNARVMMPYVEKGTVVEKSEQIPLQDRQLLFRELRSGTSLTPAQIQKLIPVYQGRKIILQGKNKEVTKINEFRFRTLEEKDFWKRLSEKEQDDFLAVWVNCPDDRKLEQLLVSQFKLTEMEADNALRTVALIGDYAPVGKTAMQRIMKYIENDGFTWTEAVEQCEKNGELTAAGNTKTYDNLPYYGEILTGRTQAVMGKAWHSAFQVRRESSGFKKPSTASAEEKYGRIANPVVHQTLNELRKIINEMITIFGYPPAEIALEVARELKVGIEEREKISRAQFKAEKERQRLFSEYCEPHNLSPKYIRYFQMMEMQNMMCPYCLKAINPDDIVNHRVDIDHILPEEDTADSSFNNLVLSHNTCNELKGKRTPYKAFSGTSKWKEIMHFMDNNTAMHFKRWRFLIDDTQYAEYLKKKGFLSRYASDNAYIAKAAQEYLACLYPQKMNEKGFPVRTYKGGETAVLRKAWNLQQIGYDIGALHLTSEENKQVASGKDRTDNRHHALDAITLVYATRSYSKLINTLKGKGIRESFAEKRVPAPIKMESLAEEALNENNLTDYSGVFCEEVADQIKNHAHISIKYDTDTNGELLKATTYTILLADTDNLVFLTRKRIVGIVIKKGVEDVESILIDKMFSGEVLKKRPESEQQILNKYVGHNEQVFEQIKSNMQNAELLLRQQNEQLSAEGKRIYPVTSQSIVKKALELTGGSYYQLSNHLRQKVFVLKEPSEKSKGIAIDTGRSLCIDLFYKPDGKLGGEIIRKVNANNNSFVPEYKKNGYKLFERLYQGDTLEIDMNDDKKAFSVHVPNALPERTIVKINTFTEISSGIQIFVSNVLKSNGQKGGSFTISSMQNFNPRKIVLSPLGYPQYVSHVLKDR